MKAINDDKKKSFLVPKLIKITNLTEKVGIKNQKRINNSISESN